MANFGSLASNFFAVQGMIETMTRSFSSQPNCFGKIRLASEPNICCGERQLDSLSNMSGQNCSANLIHAGQQEVNCGNRLPAFLRSINSLASSITVRSAAKLVS